MKQECYLFVVMETVFFIMMEIKFAPLWQIL